MSRFGEPPDPLFARINSSIAFDWRLGPYDTEQSRAHAKALYALGVLEKGELDQIDRGLERIGRELTEDRFASSEDDEDIHMAIERRLIELIGPLGGKLHTGRSRNDQVATDLAMFVRGHGRRARRLLAELMAILLETAELHQDWPAPSYTHLQRAQPVYLAHHLLAYFWMFNRDAIRFGQVVAATAEIPAGSGAAAGVNWDIDRESMAAELGFAGPMQNSLDAVSNRDFALDCLGAAATCAMHLSRLGEEIVLWSSEEFGFCEPSDSFASGSSIMPQKKNPDAAELLRGKAPRIAAAFASLVGTMHGLPLAYSKDMQEDKEPLFDAIDNLELCLEAGAKLIEGLSFNRERLEEAAGDDRLAATDIADLLVRNGVPFREAHAAVADLVRKAIEKDKQLADLGRGDFSALPGDCGKEVRRLLAERDWIESKVSAGGTATEPLRRQIEAARAALDGLE